MDDTIGKPFLVMAGGIRRCMVCDEFFTRQEASVHAQVPCLPTYIQATERICELHSTLESRR
jgi:hypothetical protein